MIFFIKQHMHPDIANTSWFEIKNTLIDLKALEVLTIATAFSPYDENAVTLQKV